MYYTRDNTYKLNHLLNYSQSFGRHDISVMLGYEQQHYEYRESDMSKLGLTDANVNDFNAAVTPYSKKVTVRNGPHSHISDVSTTLSPENISSKRTSVMMVPHASLQAIAGASFHQPLPHGVSARSLS